MQQCRGAHRRCLFAARRQPPHDAGADHPAGQRAQRVQPQRHCAGAAHAGERHAAVCCADGCCHDAVASCVGDCGTACRALRWRAALSLDTEQLSLPAVLPLLQFLFPMLLSLLLGGYHHRSCNVFPPLLHCVLCTPNLSPITWRRSTSSPASCAALCLSTNLGLDTYARCRRASSSTATRTDLCSSTNLWLDTRARCRSTLSSTVSCASRSSRPSACPTSPAGPSPTASTLRSTSSTDRCAQPTLCAYFCAVALMQHTRCTLPGCAATHQPRQHSSIHLPYLFQDLFLPLFCALMSTYLRYPLQTPSIPYLCLFSWTNIHPIAVPPPSPVTGDAGHCGRRSRDVPPRGAQLPQPDAVRHAVLRFARRAVPVVRGHASLMRGLCYYYMYVRDGMTTAADAVWHPVTLSFLMPGAWGLPAVRRTASALSISGHGRRSSSAWKKCLAATLRKYPAPAAAINAMLSLVQV